MGKKRVIVRSALTAKPGKSSADRQQRIARRAYELYLARGGRHGQDLEDWLDAEREFAEAARNIPLNRLSCRA